MSSGGKSIFISKGKRPIGAEERDVSMVSVAGSSAAAPVEASSCAGTTAALEPGSITSLQELLKMDDKLQTAELHQSHDIIIYFDEISAHNALSCNKY